MTRIWSPIYLNAQYSSLIPDVWQISKIITDWSKLQTDKHCVHDAANRRRLSYGQVDEL